LENYSSITKAYKLFTIIPSEQIAVEQLTPVHPTLHAPQMTPLELSLQVQTLGAEQRPPFKQDGVQVAKEQDQI
jgi:hypothetical protein